MIVTLRSWADYFRNLVLAAICTSVSSFESPLMVPCAGLAKMGYTASLALLLVFALFFCAIPANEIFADPQIISVTAPDVNMGSSLSTANTYCTDLISNAASLTPPAFINPLIKCFIDPAQGFIPSTTQAFLNSVETFFSPMMMMMATAAVAFFGFKLAMASLERPTSETFILLFKIGGVCYFYSHASFYYKYLLEILTSLADAISTAAISLNTDAFCNDSTDTGAAALWGRWDCIFNYLFGWAPPEYAIGGVMAFLLAMLFSSGYTGTPTGNVADFIAGSGVILVVIALYAIGALLFACMRFIHLYLMAILALSFVYCLGYLFVPLILFRNTIQYFQQWLAMIMSFILTPMLILAFMGMMLVAVDISVFSGQYSVWSEATGQTAIVDPDAFVNISNNTVDKFKPIMFNQLNNQLCSGTNTTTNSTANQQGWWGHGINCNKTEAQMNNLSQNTGRPASANIGLDTTGLNLTGIAALVTGGNVGQYLQNVLTAFLVAALISYIMYTLVQYIPELTHNLVSQNIGGRLGGFGGLGGGASGAQNPILSGLHSPGAALTSARSAADALVGTRK